MTKNSKRRTLAVLCVVFFASAVIFFLLGYDIGDGKAGHVADCSPTTRDNALLYPVVGNDGGDDSEFIERQMCRVRNDFAGRRCHHFVYAKGTPLWTRHELVTEADYLPDFLRHYASAPAPFRVNDGGQRLSHLFGVWSIARALRPRVVIESGRWRGWGLYNVRRALGPDVTIYSLDPEVPEIGDGPESTFYVDDNVNTHYIGTPLRQGARIIKSSSDPRDGDDVKYASVRDFVDIADVRWAELGVGKEEAARALVILDDHASVVRRIGELRAAGFRHFYIDDNAPPPSGDSMCPKYLVDVRPPTAQAGFAVRVLDDFGKRATSITYAENARLAERFFSGVRTYTELLPVALHENFFTDWAHALHTSSVQEIWEMTSEPLLSATDARLTSINLRLDRKELGYYYCAYLELF